MLGGQSITVTGRGFVPDVPNLYTCVFTLDLDNSKVFRSTPVGAVSVNKIVCPSPNWSAVGIQAELQETPTTFFLEEGDLRIGFVDGASSGPVVTWFSVGPVINAIPNQQLYLNAVQANSVFNVAATIDDPDATPDQLNVTVTSSNQALVKNSDISVVVRKERDRDMHTHRETRRERRRLPLVTSHSSSSQPLHRAPESPAHSASTLRRGPGTQPSP